MKNRTDSDIQKCRIIVQLRYKREIIGCMKKPLVKENRNIKWQDVEVKLITIAFCLKEWETGIVYHGALVNADS